MTIACRTAKYAQIGKRENAGGEPVNRDYQSYMSWMTCAEIENASCTVREKAKTGRRNPALD
jgi:hypothetical protein